MIDEKKLIEERPEWLNPDCAGNEEYNKGWNACNKYWRNTIKRQPKVGEWIPCSERLPEEDGFYLATLDGEIVGEEKPFSGLAEFENGKWIDDEEDYQCVLAWQPLPQPYQKGE